MSDKLNPAEKALPRLAYSIADLAAATSIGKMSIYSAAKAGQLKLTKLCGRTVILAADAEAWISGSAAAGTQVAA